MNPFYVTSDFCAGFWAATWNADVVTLPLGAQVLEVGHAEHDWQTPMLALRPDVMIASIDWRPETRPGHRVIRGDVMAHDFQPQEFDAIVSISAVEHIGLGGYDSDPLDPDGDTHCLQRCRRWLKPRGWMYFDVPYRPDGPYGVHGNFRAYDEEALQARLMTGWHERYRRICGDGEGDGPYIALVLEPQL